MRPIRMCRQEAKRRIAPNNRLVDHRLAFARPGHGILTATNASRVPRDNITWSPGRPFPRRFFQPGFSPTTRCMHARQIAVAGIARRLSGRTRAATHLHVGVASPLARSLARPSDSLTCTSTRGSIWRATDCSRVPGDPVYNSGRSRPCRAARSQSRPSRFSPRDERHPRNRAVAGVVQPSALQTFYPPFYLLAPNFNPPEITPTRMAIGWLIFKLYWLANM